MPRLFEKSLSWALYHPINNSILKRILEESIGESFREITPISRELPVVLEMKTDYTIAGYATGWQVHYVDLVVLARKKSEDYLICVEVKERANRNSLKQAMKYTAGLLTTIIPDAHNKRGDIYQFYSEQVFNFKHSLDVLYRMREPSPNRNLKLVALVAAVKAPPYEARSEVKFTLGLKRLAKKHEVELPERAIVAKIENGDRLIRRLAGERAKYIAKIYRNNEAIVKALYKAVSNNKIVKFATTKNGKPMLFLYPSGIIEFKSYAKAYRFHNEYRTPLEIINALDRGSGNRFFLQFFLNGTNNPVYFFQVKEDRFLTFQHREPNWLHYNGTFNEYIATDAKPIRSKPEAGDVLCLSYGQYFISNKKLRGLSRKIVLIPEKVYPPCKDTPAGFSTTLICPRVKKARYQNYVRPFLSNKEALETLNMVSAQNDRQKLLFDFDAKDVPFICTPIRICR